MQIASAGGGHYWNASDNEAEVDEWIQDMAGMNRGEFGERKYLVFEDRFQYPLSIAVLLFSARDGDSRARINSWRFYCFFRHRA